MAAHAAEPEQGQLDTSPTLFAVMTAINAAGYDTDADSPNGSPLRAAIRKQLAARQIPCLDALKSFYVEHRRSDPTANLSQYISFALSVDGPPDFSPKGRTADTPPDAVTLEGLTPLLEKFYEQAGIEDLWKQSQPDFDRAIERYHEQVSEAVLQVNGFLRHETSGASPTRFQIYIDLLGAPNQIQTRSYGANYYVVVTPSSEPRIRDIRHAYLHYLLDPYATRHEELVMRARGLSDRAQAAEGLDQAYKDDFLLLETESLIKAIEARIDKRPADVNEAMREGYILTAFFSEQLEVYLHQEQAMRFYYPEMIQAINLKHEDARLSQIEFVAHAPVRQVKVVEAARPPEPTGVRKTLAQAERLYTDRDLEGARELFLQALQENGEKPLHAQAYYGLARIAALERNPELAERMFEKTLEMNPEPAVKAWTLVYLARLEDAAGNRQHAVQRYREALAVEGATPGAHEAAAKGVQQSFEKKSN
ncbi:MAG: tetratricopeptide repeat protein [Bryobacteraceae bacterium]